MSIILELDPVELGENMFDLDLDNQPDLGFLSLDSKPDWSVPTEDRPQLSSSFEQKSDTKFDDFQQDTATGKILDLKISKDASEEQQPKVAKALVIVESATETGNLSGHEEFLKNSAKVKSSIKNGSQNKRRKRKNITVRRDMYKKRKDVLLKSILRKFRKYYQDEYSNFMRIKFLQTSGDDQFGTDPDVFPVELEKESSEELTGEGLELFAKSLAQKTGFFENIDFLYFGALISPRTFKDALKDSKIKINKESDKRLMMDYCSLVDEVLYKFSYQKLYRFCSIPEFGKLFKHFCNTSSLSSDETNQKYMEIVISYIDDQ